MNLREYADTEMMMLSLANQIAGDLENVLLTQDHATLAVPGGTTPGPLFDTLSAADLDWSRVTILLTDERWVDDQSDRSNAKLIRERLLQSRASAANFIPYFMAETALAEACEKRSADLMAHLPISVLLLGMGADMHIASIFPGAAGQDAALADDAPSLLPIQPDGQETRVTLTAPVLKGAMKTHLLIKGPEKRNALELARGQDAKDAPVSIVLPRAEIHWAS